MRLRVQLGLVFLAATGVLAVATLAAGPAALAAVLLLVVIVQRVFTGPLGAELRGRLDFLAALGLMLFAFIVVQRVREILAP